MWNLEENDGEENEDRLIEKVNRIIIKGVKKSE